MTRRVARTAPKRVHKSYSMRGRGPTKAYQTEDEKRIFDKITAERALRTEKAIRAHQENAKSPEEQAARDAEWKRVIDKINAERAARKGSGKKKHMRR
jgi:hypothetical protein